MGPDRTKFCVIVLKKKQEESVSYLNCCDLYVFSQDEVAKATNSFGNSNFIGEGVLGMIHSLFLCILNNN
jgi:hypothetical protein